MLIRTVESNDYNPVISVINDWWDGRHMADMLPKLFFDHFQDTSFVVVENGELIGFLIGILSQSRKREAYIHFVGIHPNYRKKGLGRQLYDLFFQTVKKKGVDTVRCVTSPVNQNSIAYHTKLGFTMEKGSIVIDNMEVHKDYDGEGQDRILLVKNI
ncbi:GNAT family N-acetyltransferase [Shimazuella sp. AN120528]|uniref:GNAT family N-acetyltransferase n=1 Tax=Shimazuella soli TaxID=1892854 RepID=UPI001F113F07|nr:GNAT family N-acetyltransferase [Shimazuella soli]MCH5584169.1 GNAT family N-acetyltransferase [Shimazuella soli]